MRKVILVLLLLSAVVGTSGVGSAGEPPPPTGPNVSERLAATLVAEVRALVEQRRFGEAWAKAQALLGIPNRDPCASLILAAQVALANPEVGAKGKGQLRELLAVLSKAASRMRTPPESDQPGRPSALAPEVYVALANLAIACEQFAGVKQLLDSGYAVALRTVPVKNDSIRKRQARALRSMVRLLVVFGKADKALSLTERHWSLISGKKWKLVKAIKGLALCRIAVFLEQQGNIPAAAPYYAAAREELKKAVSPGKGSPEERREIKDALLLSARKSALYSVWTRCKVKRITYEDPKALRAAYVALTDKMAEALKKKDLDAVLKLLEKPGDSKRVLQTFIGNGYTLKHSDFKIGPVATSDQRVSVVCKVTIYRKDKVEQSGPKTLVFVRDGEGWKIGRL